MRDSVRCVRVPKHSLNGIGVTILLLVAATNAHSATDEALAPEFSHHAAAEWINSQPQSVAALRGKPVLIEFWTFDCVNCRRTLPWMKAVQERYARDGLAIVSVHTPEFSHEKDPTNVREAVRRLGISYAVMLGQRFLVLGRHGQSILAGVLSDRSSRPNRRDADRRAHWRRLARPLSAAVAAFCPRKTVRQHATAGGTFAIRGWTRQHRLEFESPGARPPCHAIYEVTLRKRLVTYG